MKGRATCHHPVRGARPALAVVPVVNLTVVRLVVTWPAATAGLFALARRVADEELGADPQPRIDAKCSRRAIKFAHSPHRADGLPGAPLPENSGDA